MINLQKLVRRCALWQYAGAWSERDFNFSVWLGFEPLMKLLVKAILLPLFLQALRLKCPQLRLISRLCCKN